MRKFIIYLILLSVFNLLILWKLFKPKYETIKSYKSVEGIAEKFVSVNYQGCSGLGNMVLKHF